MKFYDNSNRMILSIFLLINFLIAYADNKLNSNNFENDNNNLYSSLKQTENSFLSLEEKIYKDMSEDMQFNNFFVNIIY